MRFGQIWTKGRGRNCRIFCRRLLWPFVLLYKEKNTEYLEIKATRARQTDWLFLQKNMVFSTTSIIAFPQVISKVCNAVTPVFTNTEILLVYLRSLNLTVGA